MDPFTVGMIVVVSSIVSGVGTALVVSHRIDARNKRALIEAGQGQQLLTGTADNELVKKLKQLATEQREKYDQLLAEKVDAISNSLLEIPGLGYYETSMQKLFPEIGCRIPRNVLFEYVFRNLVLALSSKGLTVEVVNERYPHFNQSGDIKITW